ncbi:MAG TPA: GntR family transcriptional regulator [Chloroflexota bacterium]
MQRLEALDFRHMGDLAHDSIRDAIISGQLSAGEKLSQDDLARQLGVSRAPIRDALNRLEAEGLVRTAPKGVVVAEMTPQELFDLFEVRALIDSYAARRACQLISGAEILLLERSVQRIAELTGGDDLHGLVRAHGDFHAIIYGACGNAELTRIAHSLWDRSYRYRLAGLTDRGVALSSLEHHREIMEAIREKDMPRAERLMFEHNQRTIEHLLQQIGGSPHSSTPQDRGARPEPMSR